MTTTDRSSAGTVPLPRDVPAYAAARAARRVPVIGSAPPPRVAGLPAGRRVVILLGGFIALVVVAALITTVFKSVPVMHVLAPVVMIGGFVALVLGGLGAQRQVFLELQRGYTTFPLSFGLASADRRAERPQDGGRLVWDYRGTWVLRSNGAVRAAPDPAYDAPGYYPSPDHPGRFELWTGRVWSGRRRPA